MTEPRKVPRVPGAELPTVFVLSTLLSGMAWGQSTGSDETSSAASSPTPIAESSASMQEDSPRVGAETESKQAPSAQDAKQSSSEATSQPTQSAPQPPQTTARDTQSAADPYEGQDQSGSPPLPPQGDEAEEEEEKNNQTGSEWEDDYDGRKEGTRGEDVLIWLLRAPLYPVHFLLNYGVRYPVVYSMTKAEEHKVFQRIGDFFTFADGKAGIYPIAFYDAGRGFWAGLNFFYNDLGKEGHDLRASAGIGTNRWLQARLKDSFLVFDNNRGKVTVSATFLRDPTFSYTGLGPDTDIDDQVFFGEEKVEIAGSLEVAMAHLNRFTMRFDVRNAELEAGRSPSITDTDSPFETDELTGFEDRFTLARFGMKLELDTRRPKNDFIPGSGFRFETWGAYNYGFGSPELNFVRYGLNPKVLIDLSGANHVLELGVYAEGVSRTGGDPIPLNELVTLGGLEHLRGFLPGRFRGNSALVYNIDYSWPLLSFSDAFIFTEVGNAYRDFYRDFSHENMVFDWGAGFRSSFSRELVLSLAVGFGTNQFDRWNSDGFHVDKTRVFVGATHRL